jgi:hypothetical protein
MKYGLTLLGGDTSIIGGKTVEGLPEPPYSFDNKPLKSPGCAAFALGPYTGLGDFGTRGRTRTAV